ncbi:unnamed protein product [Fraxinus pennsylvanica]|uniref:MI domain-containing protein n=1 Tax=Fraxinus pennsylvanica TaxID=56036 RepID=A0AAD2DRT8_9LAMI|nr:unnamed protein product [Fraxinus pennsylvanica]
MACLSKDSKGVDVIRRAEKGYLSALLHVEAIERHWGGGKNKIVEDLKDEIVKRAILMAMENRQSENCLPDLLKGAAEEGLINSSQISKGFGRIIYSVDDLSLDIPNAKPGNQAVEDIRIKSFKINAQSIIKEYFFSKKNREKEMASILLSSLCFPSEYVVSGFTMLLESAEDTTLDIPSVVEDLAMFFVRKVSRQNKKKMGLSGTMEYLSDLLSTVKNGAKSVEVDLKNQKATVTGFVDPKKVLKAAKATGKKSKPWPYVTYTMIAHPYVAGVNDRKATPNYVRDTDDPAIATLNPVEEQYILMFSDDNPNVCLRLTLEFMLLIFLLVNFL